MLDGSGENIQLFCDECSSSRGELKGLEKRIEELLTLTTDLRDRLERAERGDSPALQAKIEEIVKKEMKEAIEEREEQERIGPYLIIANIPESNKRTEEDRKVEDTNRVRAILERTELNEEELNEVTVEARLGREIREGRNRMIKIKTTNPQTKTKILKNSRLAKHRDCPASDRVYINRDLTQKQRQRGKVLRDELREKRETNREQKWIIKNDKVVELLLDGPARDNGRGEGVDRN